MMNIVALEQFLDLNAYMNRPKWALQ